MCNMSKNCVNGVSTLRYDSDARMYNELEKSETNASSTCHILTCGDLDLNLHIFRISHFSQTIAPIATVFTANLSVQHELHFTDTPGSVCVCVCVPMEDNITIH